MSLVAEERPDRRHVRRAQTIDEIVQVALDVMAEQGVGGLSLGEVARRIGIRPPSLYVYFDSKNALYDAVFEQGWAAALAHAMTFPEPSGATQAEPYLLELTSEFVRWSMENPVHAQLMMWRPVPGYEPSATAYEPAVATIALTSSRLGALQQLGKLAAAVTVDELRDSWVALVAGVITQQLANHPHESFTRGTYSRLLPSLTAMYCQHYAPAPGRGVKKGKP